MKNEFSEILEKLVSSWWFWFLLIFFGFSNPLLFILIVAGSIYYIYSNKTDTTYNFSNKNNMSKRIIDTTIEKTKKITSGFIILFIAVILLFNMVIVIPAGYTGVYHLFGKVNEKELSSGLHVINPLAKITQMSIRTEEYTMSIASGEGRRIGDDSIDALTKEGLSVALDITVLYHLNEQKASEVYEKIGLSYEEKIIRPQIRTAIRKVIATYNARDIYSEKRQEAQTKIQETLIAEIEPRGIDIESVLVRNVSLPERLETSIQEKLTAEQESQKYEFLLEKEEKEAQRKRVEAEGQRDAQAIINESLTDKYLYYQYINNLENRSGTIYVPTSGENGLPLFRGVNE